MQNSSNRYCEQRPLRKSMPKGPYLNIICLKEKSPPSACGVRRGGHGYQTSYRQSTNQIHFHSNFLGAGSAYADVTFEDA
jgi:hypothetical protein